MTQYSTLRIGRVLAVAVVADAGRCCLRSTSHIIRSLPDRGEGWGTGEREASRRGRVMRGREPGPASRTAHRPHPHPAIVLLDKRNGREKLIESLTLAYLLPAAHALHCPPPTHHHPKSAISLRNIIAPVARAGVVVPTIPSHIPTASSVLPTRRAGSCLAACLISHKSSFQRPSKTMTTDIRQRR